MPRPKKYRRICSRPRCTSFHAAGGSGRTACMTLDEYEVIRLIDLEGLTQEQCAAQMDVARTTVQAIYALARKKLAEWIVFGGRLTIGGGDVRFCEHRSQDCGRGCCKKRGEASSFAIDGNQKGGFDPMKQVKIAVTYENGEVFQHFGHTEAFKVYEAADGKVTDASVISTNGSGHGALAGFLLNQGVDVLICGGIGEGAKRALAEAGITLFGGVSGSADQAVEDYLAGNLSYNPAVTCDHHSEGHHGDHNCGGHGDGHHCGNGSCH